MSDDGNQEVSPSRRGRPTKARAEGEVGASDRIVEAADALFAERGYAGTSVQDIATRAEANKALIFYYHGSKNDLFERILGRYLKGLHNRLSEAMSEAEADPRKRLHRILDAYVGYMEDFPRYPRIVQLELARSDGPHEMIQKQNRDNFELLSAVLSTVTSDPDGPLSAEQFFFTFTGMVLIYFTNAPVLNALMPHGGAMTETALRVRKEHLHFMLDAALDRVEATQKTS